jgi:hypothetical protein
LTKLLRIILVVRPLDEVLLSHICPRFTQNTQERVWTLQCGPRERSGGGPAKFRQGRQPWPAGRGWRAAWGSPILDLRAQSGRRAVGELARWSPAAAATGARAPVKLWRWQGNKWHKEIEWGRAEPLVSSGGAGNNKW